MNKAMKLFEQDYVGPDDDAEKLLRKRKDGSYVLKNTAIAFFHFKRGMEPATAKGEL
jgi:hypothetical protein